MTMTARECLIEINEHATIRVPVPDDVRVDVPGLRDKRSVSSSGVAVGTIDGVEVKRAHSHVDARGMLTEVINFADAFWREPIVYSYTISINPGRIKGWGMHLRQVDRHFVHCGLVRAVLFDAREDSPTRGMIQQLSLGDEARGALRIPAGVWHAVQNVGDVPVHITNFPTQPYDHDDPDKRILPIDTDEIPFMFGRLDDYPR